MSTKTNKAKRMKAQNKITETFNDDSSVENLATLISSESEYKPISYKVPCNLDQEAFLPYWEKTEGEVKYGVDIYTVCAIAGCGDVWVCRVKDEKGVQSGSLEPNVDIFFSEKDAEKKINAIKKTEDSKKLAKWKRRTIDKL